MARNTKAKPPSPIPAAADRRRFRQRLLTWYRRHGRDLPWRKTSDPYHILVSEVMLQPAVAAILIRYVNRLSDLLFVMARAVNHRAGAPEVTW